jgi:hypothetical protein
LQQQETEVIAEGKETDCICTTSVGKNDSTKNGDTYKHNEKEVISVGNKDLFAKDELAYL